MFLYKNVSRDHNFTKKKTLSSAGVDKHFLRRAALKILLLPRAACSYYTYYIYNRFENFKQVLHELPQNEGNDSHFRLSKNAVSNETCGKKNLIILI